MKWIEIIVNTNTEGSDLIADAFFSIGCTGVKIIDKSDVLDIIKNQKMWDYIDEKLLNNTSAMAKVSGFVSEEAYEKKLGELLEIIKDYPNVGEIIKNTIDDEDWYENWKKYYSPIVVGRYEIVPKWISLPKNEAYIRVLIDPGLAFGTSQHESTKICLMLMSDIDFVGKRVIDVGTGSGILGIAALKSGAEEGYLCDIDSVAVKAAKENVKTNGLSFEQAVVEEADLLQGSEAPADVVCANLTADILMRLAESLLPYMKDGGLLICSGIIAPRIEEVKVAFAKIGLSLLREEQMGEWYGLLLRK